MTELATSRRWEYLHPFGVVNYSDGQESLPTIEEVRQWVKEYKLVLLRNYPIIASDEFVKWARGPQTQPEPFLRWDFGELMELKATKDAKNYLFSSEAVPLHWDGAFHIEPSVLVFQCVDSGGTSTECGGETIFVDTEGLWRDGSDDEREMWNEMRFHYRTEKIAHYGGSIDVRMVQFHPHKPHQAILRFAEPVLTKKNPVRIKPCQGSPEASQILLGELIERAKRPNYRYEHQWQVGDVLLADNHALLHGRNALRQRRSRVIRRLQLL